LDEIGGRRYLIDMTDSVVTFANIEDHIDLVLDAAARNKLINDCSDLINRGYDPNLETSGIMAEYDRRFQELQAIKANNSTSKLSERIPNRIAELKKINSGEITPGIMSGFPDLDYLTSGFRAGDLIIVGAWPNVGKTAFVLNIIDHVIVTEHKPVLFFSLEMMADSIIDRLLCARSRIPSQSIKHKESITWSDMERAQETYANAAPLIIDDSGSIKLNELRARAKRHLERHKIALIAIDHLQAIIGPTSESRRIEIEAVSKGLKALAKDLRVPTIVISHLTKADKGKGARKPTMNDLRESGMIAGDADLGILIHRDEDSHGIRSEEAEIILGKQRDGETGYFNIGYNASITKFEKREIRDTDPWGNN
jgi:replicative DNA helicase